MPRATALQPTIRIFYVLAALFVAHDFTHAQRAATPPAWVRHRNDWRQNPSVSRFYTFENLRADVPVPNVAKSESAPLQFGTAPVEGAAPDVWQVVNGRWIGKKAVRLDQGFFSGAAPKVSQRAFSAALWFRKRGQGAHRGNSDNSNGTLVSCGSGYYDGWRVTTEYPARTVAFEIGRPQGSVRVSSREAVADDAWHFLVAAWNGREMSLYIDGALAASGAYDGAYTTDANASFRIGYANYGVGSVKMDVDEAAFFNRALSSSEVLQNAFFDATISSAQATQWSQANDAIARGENAKAETLLLALLRAGQSTEVKGDAALALHPPYTTRYPELRHLGEVRTTDVWRNVAIDCGEFLRDANRKNVLDNSFGAANPGFVNPKKNDFSLSANAPLGHRLSFQPIPFSEIGLYRDEHRPK